MLRRRMPQGSKATERSKNPKTQDVYSEPNMLSKRLAAELPDRVTFPDDSTAFKQSVNSYWAQQECEVCPMCVVRPCTVKELCTVITLIKAEYNVHRRDARKDSSEALFAIRGGGHSPVPGAASIEGGILIDLSYFNEVSPSADRASVTIGAGAKWTHVSKVLDKEGLAVLGGRNSAVGVGGLTLGGGLSFFSPRFGLVCSNVIAYQLVLADGSVTTVTEATNSDLWNALKGGSNNFGIVTRCTVRSFPSTTIWSGFLYMPSYQATKVLTAFHGFVSRGDPSDLSTSYDKYAAGPIACFSYIQTIGIQVIAVNLVYTKPLEKEQKWPACWSSSFRPLWRLWSTCKYRSLTSATDEMNMLNPPGRRQVFATTTIKNDPDTLTAAHGAFCNAIPSIRRRKIKGNGLDAGFAAAPTGMGTQSFTVNWDDRRDDAFVKMTTRNVVEQIEAAATANKTGHRYRYLNYCADWQKPFDGYGEENKQFLQGVSRKYDPDGLFQKACVGGFKLEMDHGNP
ncbi:MAG: hypothetical protein Q9160_003371 [Pyrenula sp. 1 TL-2023]